MAAARELSDRASTRPRSRWASWFLQVADDQGGFLRVPLGYPALEVIATDRPAMMQVAPMEVAPMEVAPMDVAPPRPRSAPASKAAEIDPEVLQLGGVLGTVRSLLARHRLTSALLEQNLRLRQELASQFLVCGRASWWA
jgi:hypothetical protein